MRPTACSRAPARGRKSSSPISASRPTSPRARALPRISSKPAASRRSSNDGFASSDEMIAALKASGARLACLCSSDDVYAREAAAAAQALRGAGASVWLAGRPGALEPALAQAGVSGFVFAGCDALAALRAAHESRCQRTLKAIRLFPRLHVLCSANSWKHAMSNPERPFGWRKRIGLLSPTVIETAAYDFYRLAPEGVSMCATTSNIEHCGLGRKRPQELQEPCKSGFLLYTSKVITGRRGQETTSDLPRTCPGASSNEAHRRHRKTLTLPSGASDKTFWDDDLGGFGLRCGQAVPRATSCSTTSAGKTKRMTLGTTAMLDISAARAKAKDLLASVRLGGNPASEKREARAKAEETFGQSCRAISPSCELIAGRAVQGAGAAFGEATPSHSPARAGRIDRRNLQLIPPSRRTTAERRHSRARQPERLLRLADARGLARPEAPPTPTSPRRGRRATGVIGEDELRTCGPRSVTTTTANHHSGLHRAAAATRSVACAGTSRPRQGGDRDPASRMRIVAAPLDLSAPALAILRKRASGRDHVFGHGSGGFQGWSWRRKALDRRMAGPASDFALHDFRRLASTVMHEKLGNQPHVVEAVLAHVGHQSHASRDGTM